MKIHQVTMTGFGPYRDTETVDIDAFDDDGIFLISGKTGAGKSSILDAITYGLFGSVPRYDGAAGDKIRSDHIGPTDRCEVSVEFTTRDTRYRVTRTPAHDRPKKVGTGTTKEPATFELAQLRGGTWEVVESRLGNADVRIEQIVRLTAKQFLQVILLAQGQFQEFLVADSDKRRELLRMLFDTRRFSDYADALLSRTKALAAQLASSATAVGTNTASLARETGAAVPESLDVQTGSGVREWVDELVQAGRDALDAATGARTEAEASCEAARTELAEASSLAQRQTRRAQLVARQHDLEQRRPEMDVSRRLVADARRADQAWHAVEAARAATQRRAAADAAHETALADFVRLLPDEPTDVDHLTDHLQQLNEQLGALRVAAATEQGLSRLQAEVEAATTRLERFDEQAQADVVARTALDTRLAGVRASIDALEKDAAKVAVAQQAVHALTARLGAAEAAARTTAELEAALEAQVTAGQGVTSASAVRDDVRVRQRAGHAGTLAATLRPDEPCPVCGSSTHPSPAVLADDHVDDDDVERAETAYEQATRRSFEADRLVDRLRLRLESETTASAGTVDDVAAQLAEAEQVLAEAQRAVTALATARDDQRRLTDEIDATAARIEQSHEHRSSLVAARAGAQSTLSGAAESVAQSRGTHESVSARLAEVETFARATRALLDTTTQRDEAVTQSTDTGQRLASALLEHGFVDAASVAAARIPAAEVSRLESAVNAFDVEVGSTAAALASDELTGLPEQPVDVAGPQATFDEADAAHRQAIEAESAARQRFGTVDGLATEVLAELASAAQLREQYAVVNRLTSTVRGQAPNTMRMALETFALAAELEEIVIAANARLTTMTGGRYEFQHSDATAKGTAQSGLALEVLDAYTGQSRPPQSLSGGEKFQASLALALGLAEVLTNRAGGLRLDTLFIDEGFGSLDSDTLETTMATLDNLREGGRTIGLISHVEAMKESIPAQLFVDQTDGGWSTIRRR